MKNQDKENLHFELSVLKETINSIVYCKDEKSIIYKQRKTLLILGLLCLLVPFVILIFLKLDPIAWFTGLACGVGFVLLQLAASINRSIMVNKLTSKYINIEKMAARIEQIEI